MAGKSLRCSTATRQTIGTPLMKRALLPFRRGDIYQSDTEGDESVSTEKSQEEKNRELVKRMTDGLNTGEFGIMDQFWTEDMVWDGPAGIGKLHGIEEFEEVLRKPYKHAFSDGECIDKVRIAEGDYVAAYGYEYTNHTGEWLGIPASGKPIKMRYMDFWQVKGDKLHLNWVLFDILGFLEQVGYDVNKVLEFIGSKPPEFFDSVETD